MKMSLNNYFKMTFSMSISSERKVISLESIIGKVSWKPYLYDM